MFKQVTRIVVLLAVLPAATSQEAGDLPVSEEPATNDAVEKTEEAVEAPPPKAPAAPSKAPAPPAKAAPKATPPTCTPRSPCHSPGQPSCGGGPPIGGGCAAAEGYTQSRLLGCLPEIRYDENRRFASSRRGRGLQFKVLAHPVPDRINDVWNASLHH